MVKETVEVAKEDMKAGVKVVVAREVVEADDRRLR